jgi:hypothetical protein
MQKFLYLCKQFLLLEFGALCIVQDNAIIIAVDDVPEDGLDSPLRLEKLANEVRH